MTDACARARASQRYVLDTVRRADRDRFLGALFAPEPARSDLLALLAFDHELARTRSVTREPMLARIRLEWWREAVAEAAGAGKPRAQPLVELLSETVRRRGLAPEDLVALIDAREEEIDGPLDVLRAGHALADLQLAVLGIDDAPTAQAARAVAAAWLMGEGPSARRCSPRRARCVARSTRGAADPAAGPLARRHRRLAQAARLLVGGPARPILTACPGASTNRGSSWQHREREHDRCVDLFRRPDGSFGFEEFRRDVEDAGAWTPVAYHSGAAYSSMDAALGTPSKPWCGGRSVEGPIGEATWRAQRPTASRSNTRRRATRAIPPCC